MTRGRAIIFIKNNIKEIEGYSSIEFNGDMYPEEKGNGVDFFNGLKNVNGLTDFHRFIKKFNEDKNYNYPSDDLFYELWKANGLSLDEYLKRYCENTKQYNQQKELILRVCGEKKNYGDYFINEDNSISLMNSSEDDNFAYVGFISDHLYVKNLTGKTLSFKTEEGNYDLPNNQILITYFNEYYNENEYCEAKTDKLSFSKNVRQESQMEIG